MISHMAVSPATEMSIDDGPVARPLPHRVGEFVGCRYTECALPGWAISVIEMRSEKIKGEHASAG
jgi:hypothetical protein